VIVFVAGETGGDIGSPPLGNIDFIDASTMANFGADLRAKFSRSVASGGDIRLADMSNWFLRSMILLNRVTPLTIEEIDVRGYELVEVKGPV
jgi:hypothetical protein